MKFSRAYCFRTAWLPLGCGYHTTPAVLHCTVLSTVKLKISDKKSARLLHKARSERTVKTTDQTADRVWVCHPYPIDDVPLVQLHNTLRMESIMESNDQLSQNETASILGSLKEVPDENLIKNTNRVTISSTSTSTSITSQTLPTSEAISDETSKPYTSRKPKWWKRLGQGRPTKGQKKAMAALESTHQLPRIPYGTTYDWSEIFSTGHAPSIWLEIGCGTGENVFALANSANPQTMAIVGAEMHPSGYGKCFQRLYQATQRQRLWRGSTLLFTSTSLIPKQDRTDTADVAKDDKEQDSREQVPALSSRSTETDKSGTVEENYNDEDMYSSHVVPNPYPHVRFFAGNGVTVLQRSPTESLDAVLITFPDPFPRSHNYRLLQLDVLEDIYRVLRQGGKLVVATDHDGYAAWVQDQIQWHNGQLHHRDNGANNNNNGGGSSGNNENSHNDSNSISVATKWVQLETTTALRMYYLPAVSRYEAKGWREGRTTKLLIYEKFGKGTLPITLDE